MMSSTPKTVMVFVDGLGMGMPDPAVNPLYSGGCPTLLQLMEKHAKPIDAQLGVPGLPQSATGQTALLTGVNASQAVGRHMEGFPGPALRKIIRKENIFTKLTARGYNSTFANAYYLEGYSDKEFRRRRSVTTIAALEAFGGFRDTKAMLAGQAVYQDLTRKALRKRGYEGPLVEPAEAGRHLVEIGRTHDFTLFEYFQTDIAAHRGSRQRMEAVLADLDEFLTIVLEFMQEDRALFVLTSDHGNLEEFNSRLHTENPVPFIAIGQDARRLQERVGSLVDIVPALLENYPSATLGS